MPRPALIVVHPGSLAAHAGTQALDDAICEIEAHDGPIIIIDGYLSDKVRPFDKRIQSAFSDAEGKGEFVARLWGCDAGESPFAAWQGYVSPGVAVDIVHECQETAAKWIAPILRSRDVVLSGAWASHSGNTGCVNSVLDALTEGGWRKEATFSDNVIYEEDMEV